MQDKFGRSINYLRISVTDRCNFRCVYCLPRQGVRWLEHSEIMSYEEIVTLIRIFNREGITKIRLTGGEPLVRKNIVGLVGEITKLKLIEDLSLTTNGSLLSEFAYQLKAAGLNRVNISLDTADKASFREITGGGYLEDTMKGVEAALAADLSPVKLNVVLTDNFCSDDLTFFIKQLYEHPVAVRFIECMPFDAAVRSGPAIADVRTMLADAGFSGLERVDSLTGNGPAEYYTLPGSQGLLGFISPLTAHFCNNCNRIRLTADGKLKPCLLSNREFDILTPLRSGASEEDLSKIYKLAVASKPRGHCLSLRQNKDLQRSMCQIGG